MLWSWKPKLKNASLFHGGHLMSTLLKINGAESATRRAPGKEKPKDRLHCFPNDLIKSSFLQGGGGTRGGSKSQVQTLSWTYDTSASKANFSRLWSSRAASAFHQGGGHTDVLEGASGLQYLGAQKAERGLLQERVHEEACEAYREMNKHNAFNRW